MDYVHCRIKAAYKCCDFYPDILESPLLVLEGVEGYHRVTAGVESSQQGDPLKDLSPVCFGIFSQGIGD